MLKPVVIAAFTREGVELALRLAENLGAAAFAPARLAAENKNLTPMGSVYGWADEWFSKARALVFISSAGIAFRAAAPHVRDKTSDPAVIALDDAGQNVIPLLSGHIGGGNGLAVKIAALTGGRAVITTATDSRGIEAPDEWAVKNNCAIENPEAIKTVSAAMLDKKNVGVAITDELFPAPPWPVTLWLRPRTLILGIGCKRGISPEALDSAAEDFLKGAGKSAMSLKAVASIDLKKDEPAVLAFCRGRGLPLLTYSAEELSRAEGKFSSSAKVLEITGVDNVCERAAALASGGGVLLRSKTLYPGAALALAREAEK